MKGCHERCLAHRRYSGNMSGPLSASHRWLGMWVVHTLQPEVAIRWPLVGAQNWNNLLTLINWEIPH